MKIVFFGNASERIAAIRYRIGTFARMLEADGHTCVVCLPMSMREEERYFDSAGAAGKVWMLCKVLARRLAQLRHVPWADVVYFRGPLFPYGPPVLERVCRWLNPRLVFDIDDAIWEPPAHVDSAFLRLVDYGWTRKMARLCAHGVVGNETLKAYVTPLNPNVTIIPTCIDMDLHREREYGSGITVTLGWTGLKDNLGYLRPIEPVLQELSQAHTVRLHIATGNAYRLDGVTVVNERWIPGREIAYLRYADIGLMPLHDTPRARGKCAFKALQYMAVGTPVVLSPVGMNAEVVEDGVHGFLADSPEEWKAKLERLIADPALGEKMGRAARERVRERYSHDVYYPVLRALLQRVAGVDRVEKSDAVDGGLSTRIGMRMPLTPSNDQDIALAQEWLGELDAWLETHGTAGPDPFDIKAHRLIRGLQDKPLLRRASTVLCDAFPHAARRTLGVPVTENPKTHALLAIGKLRLFQLSGENVFLAGAETHLHWLLEHPADTAHGLGWGYPFGVAGQGLETAPNTPVSVVSAIAGEAFLLAHTLTDSPKYRKAAEAIARHFIEDLPRLGESAEALCFAYGPEDCRAVHNANLLVAQHLLEVAVLNDDEAMARLALRAVQFTLNGQRPDGAFPYGAVLPGQPYEPELLDLVDHHHTGFVLRSLYAINRQADNGVIKEALRKGFAYFRTLCADDGMPRDAARTYPVDIHACAEAILCPAVLKDAAMGAGRQSTLSMRWTWSHMRDRHTGAPHFRKYRGFTSKIAYPRWGVAWMYRALAEYLWAFQGR